MYSNFKVKSGGSKEYINWVLFIYFVFIYKITKICITITLIGLF